jgi:hypothetical protein
MSSEYGEYAQWHGSTVRADGSAVILSKNGRKRLNSSSEISPLRIRSNTAIGIIALAACSASSRFTLVVSFISWCRVVHRLINHRSYEFRSAVARSLPHPLPAGIQNLYDAHTPQLAPALSANWRQPTPQASGFETRPPFLQFVAFHDWSISFFQPAQAPGNGPHRLLPMVGLASSKHIYFPLVLSGRLRCFRRPL